MRSLSRFNLAKFANSEKLASAIFLSIMCNALITAAQTPMLDSGLEIEKCEVRRTCVDIEKRPVFRQSRWIDPGENTLNGRPHALRNRVPFRRLSHAALYLIAAKRGLWRAARSTSWQNGGDCLTAEKWNACDGRYSKVYKEDHYKDVCKGIWLTPIRFVVLPIA